MIEKSVESDKNDRETSVKIFTHSYPPLSLSGKNVFIWSKYNRIATENTNKIRSIKTNLRFFRL